MFGVGGGRWARFGWIAPLLLVVVAGCGGGENRGSALDRALAYLPAHPSAVVVIPTDVHGTQIRALDRVLARSGIGGGVDQLVRELARSDHVSESDVRAVLGNELVFGTYGGLHHRTFVVALVSRDRQRLQRMVAGASFTKVGHASGAELYAAARGEEPYVAIRGEELVVTSDQPGELRRVLAGRGSGSRLTRAAFERALAGLPRDALARGYGDLMPFPRTGLLAPFRSVPWAQSLRTLGASLSLKGREASIDVVVATDPARLTARDLPLATTTSTPPLPTAPGKIVSANANQSATTVFLLRAVRAALPSSRFVRDVARLERVRRIDFEHELLRQFDGPSVTVLDPDGRGFASRSVVHDPRRLAGTLRRIAPDLGRLVQDLDGLRSRGMALLLLLAPDAPATPSALGGSSVRVSRVPGRGLLYRTRGLRSPAPTQVVFGLIGNVFVVGSDERRARAIASAAATPITGVAGPVVARAGIVQLNRLASVLGNATRRLPPGELSVGISATTSGLRAHVRIDFTGNHPKRAAGP